MSKSAFHPCAGVGDSEGDAVVAAWLVLAGALHCSCPHLGASRRCHQAGGGHQDGGRLTHRWEMPPRPLRPTALQAGWKTWPLIGRLGAKSPHHAEE